MYVSCTAVSVRSVSCFSLPLVLCGVSSFFGARCTHASCCWLHLSFCRTARWRAEEAEAKETKKTAVAAYCSLCPVVLQMITRQPCPELLAPLVSLAERGPQFFRDQHAALLGTVKTILANSASVQTEETGRMALQLAASAFLGAPKFSRKVGAFCFLVCRCRCRRLWALSCLLCWFACLLQRYFCFALLVPFTEISHCACPGMKHTSFAFRFYACHVGCCSICPSWTTCSCCWQTQRRLLPATGKT